MGAPVVLVNVAYSPDFGDALTAPVDVQGSKPVGGFHENWTDLIYGLKYDSDICITKRHWGAFYGTELDLQLRRRGIDTIVLGGISTNQGVESTARAAHEHGYGVVFAEDATTALTKEMHTFAYENIFPRIDRVVESGDLKFL